MDPRRRTIVGRVSPPSRPGLENGTSYTFKVRAVNGVGSGQVATAEATLAESAPGAPANLTATGGDEQVALSWGAPADGGSQIIRYEYRLAAAGETYSNWVAVSGGGNARSHTETGLTNGTEYGFQFRAVNGIGEGPHAEASATPGRAPTAPTGLTARSESETITVMWGVPADDAGSAITGCQIRYRMEDGQWTGTPTSSDLVFVNVANTAVAPVIYFYDRGGNMIDADTVVDAMMEGIEFSDDGALTVMDEIPPMGEMTISTSGIGEGVRGSVRVVSDGPIGGVLRFDIPTAGVAGVGSSEAVNAAIFPARYMEGGINTGAAIRNLESEMMTVTCRLMRGGQMVDRDQITLAANGQDSEFITEKFEDAFMAPGMSGFEGSVHCSAPEGMMFTGVALEMDFINRVFTTLPVVPVR